MIRVVTLNRCRLNFSSESKKINFPLLSVANANFNLKKMITPEPEPEVTTNSWLWVNNFENTTKKVEFVDMIASLNCQITPKVPVISFENFMEVNLSEKSIKQFAVIKCDNWNIIASVKMINKSFFNSYIEYLVRVKPQNKIDLKKLFLSVVFPKASSCKFINKATRSRHFFEKREIIFSTDFCGMILWSRFEVHISFKQSCEKRLHNTVDLLPWAVTKVKASDLFLGRQNKNLNSIKIIFIGTKLINSGIIRLFLILF